MTMLPTHEHGETLELQQKLARVQSLLEASRQVKRLKPFYSEAQIALGISKAKEFLYKPTRKDLEELKKETGIWQRASLKSLEH